MLMSNYRNGTEWYRLRKAVAPLMAKNVYESFIPQHKEIAVDFIKYIRLNRNENGCLDNIFSHMTKFSVEGKYYPRNCNTTL